MQYRIFYGLLSFIFVQLAYSLHGQSMVAGSYIHFRSFEKNGHDQFPHSGSGGIIELRDSVAVFIRDSVETICRRKGNKIWFNDSTIAQVIYEYPDSLRLLLNNMIHDYRPLLFFSNENDDLLPEVEDNTWDIIAEDISLAVIPKNLKSQVLHGGNLHLLVGFINPNDVKVFHLKVSSYKGSITLFGFDLSGGFTTIQLTNRKQDTVSCEMYRFGMLIQCNMVKNANLNADSIHTLKEQLRLKSWLATWNYQERKPIPSEIQLLSKNFSQIECRQLQKRNVTIQFNGNGVYYYNKGKDIEKGIWNLSPDGKYILLESEEGNQSCLKISGNSTNEITLSKTEHLKYNRELLFGESINFR